MFRLLQLLIFPVAVIAAAVCHSPAVAQLMDAKTQARLDAAAPQLGFEEANDALHGRGPGKRLFYTGDLIEHAQQDHSDGEVGFYLSSHNRSAFRDGLAGTDFEFPWKDPGGTTSDMTYSWKVLYLPPDTKITVYRTKLRSFFSGVNGRTFSGGGRGSDVIGYDWEFPKGTRLFELLSFPDRLTVFEVRMRLKTRLGTWHSTVYRPFPTHMSLSDKIEDLPPPKLRRWRLHDTQIHRNRSAFDVTSSIDDLPGFSSTSEVDTLIKGQRFTSVAGRDWSDNNDAAPSTASKFSIVPVGYSGAFVGSSQQSCVKCHRDAGTHVRFFDGRREWYGFVRGSKTEGILSFHPIDPTSISRNGSHRQVALNKLLVDAGMVEWWKGSESGQTSTSATAVPATAVPAITQPAVKQALRTQSPVQQAGPCAGGR